MYGCWYMQWGGKGNGLLQWTDIGPVERLKKDPFRNAVLLGADNPRSFTNRLPRNLAEINSTFCVIENRIAKKHWEGGENG